MIDGGLSRTPRPSDRQPAPRPAPVRQPDPAVSPAQPEAVRPHQSRAPHKKRRKGLFIGLIAAVIIVASLASWLVFFRPQPGVQIDSNKFQAVFLSNGQVYFGRLSVVNDQYLKLSGVFYIQSQESTTSGEQAAEDAAGMQLIKLGEEVHGPEDAMMINRDQMLFFENLKSDGKVTQLIQQHNKGGN